MATTVSEFLDRETHGPIIGESPYRGGGDARPSTNPATGDELTVVHQCTADDVNTAVQEADTAFRKRWSRFTPQEREELIFRYADVVSAHSDELALIETLDNGMPLAAAYGSVARCIAHLRYNAGWATKITGDSIEPSKHDREFFAYTQRQPVGVIAAIVPWNSPLVSTVLKVSAGLAAGCTIVIKPATETPLSALRLVELAREADIPPGVLNVVPGSGSTVGQALVEHPLVRKVSFTGSTDVGQSIIRSSAAHITRLTLELGGKSPDIIFPDSDLNDAVPKAAWAIFRNSGQVCVAGSRLLVHNDIYDEFVQRLVDFTETITVGQGIQPETQLGPLITEAHTEKVLGYVASGVSEGARLLTGGKRLRDELRPSGQFVTPGVFSNVDPQMRIAREEIFGPIVTTSRFTTLDEAATLANHTPYGLAAGIWTNDVSTAHKMAARLDAGMIWVNCYSEYDPALPFGGHKLSGHGAKSGREAVLDCTELKTVVMELRDHPA